MRSTAASRHHLTVAGGSQEQAQSTSQEIGRILREIRKHADSGRLEKSFPTSKR